ncbi:UDP-4-amino-4-deoxy-L-arabinose--oxoglutarate aminotransferase [Porphyromonas levii]|nr:UDP-4-amino-4-deoxy-L-arabinose--oxoglutarate aminotransferase [Porphyromonas levii]
MMEKKRIWLSLAEMGGNEQKYIKEAFDTNWVVPLGPNVNAFEADLKAYLAAPAPRPPKGGVLGSADPAYYDELKRRAIYHRNNPTEAESIMWELLSGKQLGGYKFRRQHIIGRFIVDFVCLDKMLIIEIDGGYHEDLTQQESDKTREEWLMQQGYRVIRFTNKEVIANPAHVLNTILTETGDAPFRGVGGLVGGLSVVALSAGTAALHLALVMLGVGAGDEVICQSFTFSASANPIKYQGAKPVFVDSEEGTWNMCPTALRRAIEDRIKVTGKVPKAIIPVHLYGMPAKMDEILAVAAEYDIPVVEDAAEALGSAYKGRKCGTLGKYGALSFNGNKIITTSGGGALVTHSEEEAKRVMFFATQARENAPHYQHEHVGYNYRLSNISAGIGRGQMEVLQEHVDARRHHHVYYQEQLKGVPGITVMSAPSEDFDSNYWLTCITIDSEVTGYDREALRLKLDAENIESRPLWKPMHLQPVFADCPFYSADQKALQHPKGGVYGSVCESLFDQGLCLPSGSALTTEDLDRVIEVIKGN